MLGFSKKHPFGVSRWKRQGLEIGARQALLLMRERDKRVILVDFDGGSEPMLMVFARGERVEDARSRLADLIGSAA